MTKIKIYHSVDRSAALTSSYDIVIAICLNRAAAAAAGDDNVKPEDIYFGVMCF